MYNMNNQINSQCYCPLYEICRQRTDSIFMPCRSSYIDNNDFMYRSSANMLNIEMKPVSIKEIED